MSNGRPKGRNLLKGKTYRLKKAQKRYRQGYDVYDEKTKHWSSVDPRTGKYLKSSKHESVGEELNWYFSPKSLNFRDSRKLVTHNILGKEKKYYKYKQINR